MNKGVQVVPKAEDQLSLLRREVDNLKEASPLSMTEPIVQLQLKYEQTLKFLERKLQAYKVEYIKEKSLGKKQ